MDEAKSAELRQLGSEVDDLMEEVEAADEEHATFQTKYQTRVKVEDLVSRFRQAVAGMDPMDRAQVDRTVGRKVIDLQKMSSHLPAPPTGKPVESRAKNEFWETREGKSSRKPITIGAGASSRPAGKWSVADEIDAWCGGCADVKTHVISAMVGDEPAQVVCQVCRKTHKYKAAPPDRDRKPAATRTTSTHRPSAGEAQSEKKMKERDALLNTLAAAEKVREYSPKERYRVGEIVAHPEHGRGKIENVLPRSLMVRFPIGLRTLKLS